MAVAKAKNTNNLSLTGVGNNIWKTVTIAELVRAECKLNMFSRVNRIEHEESSYTKYEAYLSK